MSDRSSMLNDTGDSSQFYIWGLVSVILHAFVVAGMFYLPELNIPEIKPTVITIDLSTMPSLEPPAKKKGTSLPKASKESGKSAADSGAPVEPVENERPAPKGDIEKAPPPKPEPKKETPPPPHKEPPKPEPKPKVEEKKPKEAPPREDVVSTKPKKEDKKPEKKEPKEEKSSEVKDDKKEAKKDTKDDKTPPEKEPVEKESKDKEPKKDGKVGDKDGSEKSDALARMRKKAALKAAASKAASGDGEGNGGGGEEGDPRGSEKGSIHGVDGGSEKGGVSASVADFYFYEIARYLGKNWVFADSVSGGKGLEALVILHILPNGELKEPPLFKKRSGNSYFDDTVYRTIMKTVPFPAFPQGIKQSDMAGEFRFTPEGIK